MRRRWRRERGHDVAGWTAKTARRILASLTARRLDFLAVELPTDWIGGYNNPDFSGDPSALAKEAWLNPFFWYGSSIER
jgi:hypothetical protein